MGYGPQGPKERDTTEVTEHTHSTGEYWTRFENTLLVFNIFCSLYLLKEFIKIILIKSLYYDLYFTYKELKIKIMFTFNLYFWRACIKIFMIQFSKFLRSLLLSMY